MTADPSVPPDSAEAAPFAKYQIVWRGFTVTLLLVTAGLCGVTWWLMGLGLNWILPVASAGMLGGAAVTMTGMTWASVMALLDNSRKGALFVIFPPYMVYYTIRNWRFLWQPALVFLCGLIWAGVTLWAALARLPAS